MISQQTTIAAEARLLRYHCPPRLCVILRKVIKRPRMTLRKPRTTMEGLFYIMTMEMMMADLRVSWARTWLLVNPKFKKQAFSTATSIKSQPNKIAQKILYPRDGHRDLHRGVTSTPTHATLPPIQITWKLRGCCKEKGVRSKNK